MADDAEVLDRLDRYAKACARNVLAKFDLGHDRHRAEGIAQNLYLAGWQVWSAKGNHGWAKHRMSDGVFDQLGDLGDVDPIYIPEPSTLVLLSMGAFVAFCVRNKRRPKVAIKLF